MRETFLNKMEQLNSTLLQMARLVETSLENILKAIKDKDINLATNIIDSDKEVDQKMRIVESMCIKLLLKQQPVACDLRQISAALKMVSDLERIGDQTSNIAEIFTTLPENSNVQNVPEIYAMGAATQRMLQMAIRAINERDLDLGYRVCDSDDQVNMLFLKTKKNLIERIKNEDESSAYAMDFFMIAKYFERIGDHIVNVAKWTIFSGTGVRSGVNYLTPDKEKLDEK